MSANAIKICKYISTLMLVSLTFAQRSHIYDASYNTEYESFDRATLYKHELEFLQDIFRGAPIWGTPMEGILTKGTFSQYHETIEGLTFDGIIDRIRNNKQLSEEFALAVENFNLKYSLENDNPRLWAARRKGKISGSFSRKSACACDTDTQDEECEQTGGYEGCKMDYASLAEPITNFILNLTGHDVTQSRNRTDWAGKMLDALAKIPAALTDGNAHWVGGAEMCEQDVKADYCYIETVGDNVYEERRKFSGNYCRLELKRRRRDNATAVLSLMIGLCVPGTCSPEDVKKYILEDNPVFYAFVEEVLGFDIHMVFCGHDLDSSTDPLLKGAIYFQLSIVVIAVLATLYDGIIRKRIIQKYLNSIDYKPKPQDQHLMVDDFHEKTSLLQRCEMAFVGFSYWSNLKRIFNTETIPGQMDCINGLKVLSFAWAILGGTVLYGTIYVESWTTSNLLPKALDYPTRFMLQFLPNFHFSSDTFFVISGFLTAYWWFRYYDKEKRVTLKMILTHYLHRWWRIWPTYMMVLLLFTATVIYTGGGPLSAAEIGDGKNCRVSWWVNMLFLHNLVKTDEQCMAPQWYLSTWMQLHLVVPLILVPLVLKPLIGYIVLAVFYVAHIAATAAISSRIYDNADEGLFSWYIDLFQSPWGRAGTYLIGIALAVIIRKHNYKPKLKWYVAQLGWLVGLFLLFAPVFATYSRFQKLTNPRWDKATRVTWDTLGRSSFGLGIAWFIYACMAGWGGFVGSFLSWRFFLPFSRLEFGTYLMHVMFIFTCVYGRYNIIYYNILNLLYMTLANIWILHLVGLFLVNLNIHYPISLGLERALRAKNKFDYFVAGRFPEILQPIKTRRDLERSFLLNEDEDVKQNLSPPLSEDNISDKVQL